MGTDAMILPIELFEKVVSYLHKDIPTLYACALVCRVFYSVATPLLYKRIHVSPPKVGLAWQIVEDTLGRKPFAASRLPTHAKWVQEFTLDGYLTKIRPSRQTPIPIIDKIPDALKLWCNLQVVNLVPQKATGTALHILVKTLRQCPSLRAITLNEFSLEEDVVQDLAEVTGLEDVTLIHPTRAAIMALRCWLEKNKDTLVSLRLLGNCGSLTPGILRMIRPSIFNIRTLAIGLSYSLTNADVFACLSQLPWLQDLRLRYYRQYGILPQAPELFSLRRLTVLHTLLSSREEADALSAWIRRISSASPLESLETISSDLSGLKLCFDGLISHIASKHRGTLHEIRMPKAYVRSPALRNLLTKCTLLEHLSLIVSFSTLQALPGMAEGCANLRSISLDVCDQPRLVIEKKDALKVMLRTSHLRCITVHDVTWKGTWVAQQDEDGHVIPEFVAGLIANVTRDQGSDEL